MSIKVGITSWTERSLVESGWYPRDAHDPASRLRWYATQFPIVENDSTHYAVPEERVAREWVERTPRGFTMNVKAFATMSDHYTEARQLPPDLRARLSPALLAKRHVYPRDLGDELCAAIARRFRDAIEPLRASGRLGLVLFQYPVWFPWSRANEKQLARTRDLVPGCRVAIELRNATWMDDRAGGRARTLDFLRAHDLVYTCVDEPQGSPASVPPIAEATADVALVRFHGRARATWTRGARTARERFDYLYAEPELAEWVPRIRALAERAHEVHVLMNNCHGDYPVRNARALAAMLATQAAPTYAVTSPA